MGLDVCDWSPWDQRGRRRHQAEARGRATDGLSGFLALSLTRKWWETRGRRGRSAEDFWDLDYRQPLDYRKPLAALKDIQDLLVLPPDRLGGYLYPKSPQPAAGGAGDGVDGPGTRLGQ
jgi:hypothetical protein